MIILAAGLLGLVVGIFLNVVIHRVPLTSPWCGPRRAALPAASPIRPVDNVPVLSYLLLRGRCRSCKVRISARYPLVEVLTGALFAAAAYEFGLDLRLLSALVLISTLIALAGIDLEHRLLPNAIVGPAGSGRALALDPGEPGVVVGVPGLSPICRGRTVRAGHSLPGWYGHGRQVRMGR